ncbi:hypothetical protein A9Z42_0046350 [Trichoderma parareesei]|uniref:Uncharacterized protein n=1 Tax=Trichoderma parareesei TaxID=858221 RepID=A0A2H2YVY9_TRIPA|nr:hypothetical protein A9Z42_0046350 [Trichoderma parareesei]
MQTLIFAFLTFLIILAGFQLRGHLRKFFRWVAPVSPLDDSRLKQKLRKWIFDTVLAAFLACAVLSTVDVSEFLGRLAGRLI